MNVLINYADEKYASAQHWNSWTAKHIAKVDKVFSFHPENIDTSFFNAHREILSQKRGNGLWLWKPYFVNQVIHTLNDGDTIFYCDSGAIFIRNLNVVYDSLNDKHPLFVCDIPLIESCWTKPLCFTEMDCNSDSIKFSSQIIGTYFAIYVNNFTRKFVAEWLSFCCRYDLLLPEGLPKKMILEKYYGTDFISHREDQSIFSLMCKKYSIIPHKDISQRPPNSYFNSAYAYSEPIHATDNYKPIVYLHKQPSLHIFLLKRLYTILRLNKLKSLIKYKIVNINNKL